MTKGFVGLGVVALLSIGACTAVPVADETKEDVSSETESSLVAAIADLGEIPGSGEVRSARYSSPPRYASFTFYANGGEEVDAWVRGQRRADAVGWILDAGGHVLAHSDDADGTLDSHLAVKLPTTLGTKAKLRIVFREYRLRRATFDVSVRVKPGMFACTTDTDCVKISRGGCCSSGAWVAVNASRADDYAADHVCKPPYPPCAPPPVGDDPPEQVALCESNACVIGPPRGCFYNGEHKNVGDSFPSSDGCNTCTCGPNGNVGCTKRACLPKTCDESREPNRKYVAHSPEQCMLVRYACEPGTTPFSGACGCGCEQPSDCPAFINCMPGPGVASCEPSRARCPYTPVAF